MTVSTTNFYTTALGNGVSTEFDFDFTVNSALDVNIYYIDADDVQTLLTSDQYTITLNPVATGALWSVGGTVQYPLVGLPIEDGTQLLIQRATPYQQTTTISNQGSFYPQAVEQAMDKLEMQVQQLIGNGTAGLTSVMLMEGVTPSAAISEMPFAGNLTSFDYIPIVSDALNYKAYLGDILAVGPIEVAFEFLGGSPPVTSEVLGAVTFTSAAIFPGNLTGSVGDVIGTNPTGNFTSIIEKNGSTVGNMTINTSGAFSFATTGNITISAGDNITFVAPVSVDASLADFCWTITGTRTG